MNEEGEALSVPPGSATDASHDERPPTVRPSRIMFQTSVSASESPLTLKPHIAPPQPPASIRGPGNINLLISPLAVQEYEAMEYESPGLVAGPPEGVADSHRFAEVAPSHDSDAWYASSEAGSAGQGAGQTQLEALEAPATDTHSIASSRSSTEDDTPRRRRGRAAHAMDYEVEKPGPKMAPRPKRYQCTWEGCSKAFTRPSTLGSHMNEHTNTRPYACAAPDCFFSFVRKHDLLRHVRSVHGGNEEELSSTIECAGCGKSYSRLDALRRHEKSCKYMQ
ncbi:hypothetical protein BC830DRAFT_1089500 [Chytriomyces sp. MP71]|nr:hypothetical protein BC830DRAFT_1089500 [Chytriomyces sp. MP71]